ncbi:hypothetical protein Poli38472_004777 [Pythium oligandrum]|uniref:Uncharacterized protein n=1 Tax=Pythium oligandrum TaxID=41045 RepID=A0A8K1CBP0_PYTOL|nr:hypothetical protein Poli38472_004777 [Pythium oligandrum]|eukprot:TMW59708.1 hypothetical protein Poli38472_004777 [Pythium oligandrum]
MGGNTNRTTSPDAVSEVEDAETVDPLRSVVKQDVQTSVDAFWKRMAQRQSDARQQSLAENMRLREMLEGQLKVARALERLLRKRSLMPDEETTTPRSNPMIKRIRLDPRHEANIYAALVELFDARYLETDRRLEESGLAANKATFQDAQFTGHGSGMDWYLTFLDSRVLPFPYAIARDVAWRSMQSFRIELDHGVYETIECTDDLIKAKFMITLSVRNTEVRGTTWFAMRRYLEAERMVLVWAVWSVAEGGVLKNRAIQLIEDGWSIVEPLAGTEYSVAQVYGRLQPDPTALVDSAEEHIGLLTDMILVKYHQNLGGLYVRLETMLMEEACPGQ